jgi:uncharacterized membrane protein
MSLALLVALAVAVSVMLIIYLTWEAPRSQHIHLQGRYFIPIGPLIALALSRLGITISKCLRSIAPVVRLAAMTVIPCLLLLTAHFLKDRYFTMSL